MDTVEILAFEQELVLAHVPGNMSCLSHNLLIVRRCYESFLLFCKILFIFKRKRFPKLLL